MKLIIAGSRHLNPPVSLIQWLLDREGIRFFVEEVVSGGAGGIDFLGEVWAKLEHRNVKYFLPDWSKGKKAGPIRNRQMAEYADALLLIWDGKSRGSASMKREAERAGIPIYEFDAEGKRL